MEAVSTPSFSGAARSRSWPAKSSFRSDAGIEYHSRSEHCATLRSSCPTRSSLSILGLLAFSLQYRFPKAVYYCGRTVYVRADYYLHIVQAGTHLLSKLRRDITHLLGKRDDVLSRFRIKSNYCLHLGPP